MRFFSSAAVHTTFDTLLMGVDTVRTSEGSTGTGLTAITITTTITTTVVVIVVIIDVDEGGIGIR